jgi:hypothetical protein
LTRDDFTFFHTLRVRWAEVDRQDVVFNGHYFLYFDVAVSEYWRAIGFNYPQDIVDRFGTDIYAVLPRSRAAHQRRAGLRQRRSADPPIRALAGAVAKRDPRLREAAARPRLKRTQVDAVCPAPARDAAR